MDEVVDQAIYVEFPVEAGVHAVARSPQDLAKDSAKALGEAMGAIKQMSKWARNGLDDLVDPPDEVEVAFGLKLTAEAGVLVSKVGGEAALQVRVAWKRDSAEG